MGDQYYNNNYQNQPYYNQQQYQQYDQNQQQQYYNNYQQPAYDQNYNQQQQHQQYYNNNQRDYQNQPQQNQYGQNYYDQAPQQQSSFTPNNRRDDRSRRDDNRGGGRSDRRDGGRDDKRHKSDSGNDRRDKSSSSSRGGSSSSSRESRRDDRKESSSSSRDRDRDSKESTRSDKDSTSSSGVKKEEKDRFSERPPPRLRKRDTWWDIAPIGFETGTAMVGNNLPTNLMNPHQTRQAKRIYVGNIPAGISELEIAEFFNTAMFTAGATQNNNPAPVVAVQMNREKAFAFLEFGDISDASAAMGFDGITLQGHALKVRRPKDYKPIAEAENAPTKIANIISTNVAEGPNKIFAGGLPAYLNEEQVKQLISTFGQLRSFNLVRDNNTVSKGFAFFEYVDPNVTDRACQGLNGMKIGEKTILVQRANIGAKQMPLPKTEGTDKSILTNPTAINFLNLGMPIAAAASLLGLNINDPGPTTRILLIINAVTPEELLIDEEYQDILEDIQHEMKRFGTILSITIPRPPPPPPPPEINNPWALVTQDVGPPSLPTNEVYWGVGKIFIEYKTKEEAKRAQQTTAGRKFNGHTCITGFWPEDKYAIKKFDPDWEEEKAVADRFRREKDEKEREEIERARKQAMEDIAEMEALEEMNRKKNS